MNRKDFLMSIGLSGGGLMLAACLGGCKKTDVGSAPTVDFTLDLSLPAYTALNAPGGYIYSNGVIVAKTIDGNIVAVSQSCTHEGVSVQYQGSADRFYCSGHGATFNTVGAVTTGPASSALKKYTVTVNGNVVRVNG